MCVIERNGKWGHTKNDHIEATSNNFSKQYINYSHSWHRGTINKLPYSKQHYRNEHTPAGNLKWPSLPNVTQWVKTAWDYYQIIQEVLYQQWFRWHRKWCIVDWTVWQIQHWLWWRRRRYVWWHMNRYNRCSVKRVMMMNFLVLDQYGWFSASYIRVRFQGRLLVLKSGTFYMRVSATYTWVYTVFETNPTIK